MMEHTQIARESLKVFLEPHELNSREIVILDRVQ